MKPTSFSMKSALLATLIFSGQSFAQSLPDEINHPQYLKIYQNLDQVLNTKTAEYNTLAGQKAELEKSIGEMERDQVGLPGRNSELQKLIELKKADLSRIDTEMTGLEAILSKVIEDLRRIDAMLAQLQKDVAQEQASAQQIQLRRNQVAQDLSRVNGRLQQERAEEQQSITLLNNLNRGMNNDIQKRTEDLQDRQNLSRDVDRYKREVPGLKIKLANGAQASTAKKAQLLDAQTKLPTVKAQLASESALLAQAESEMNPKKAKLAELKAELGRQMPEVAKLQKEIADLNAKIELNKAKINNSGLNSLIARRDALEKELSGVNSQISSMSSQIVELKEALKPDLGQMQEVRKQITLLERSGANPTELARLKNEYDAMEKRIAPKRQEIARLEKQYDALVLSVAPKNQELAGLKDSISKTEAAVAVLVAENAASQEKINADQKIIDERTASNSGLIKEINALEAAIKELDVNRDRLAKSVSELKAQDSLLTTQIASLSREVQQLELEAAQLTKSIADMEKAIVDFPLDIRRIDNRVQKYEEQIQAARQQIVREEKLLARIQQDRATVERESAVVQAELTKVSNDLAQSNQLIGALQNKIQQESQNREALTRYNQDSIRKYDILKNQKADSEKVIADSNSEISDNNQDIATIAQELPKLRGNLAAISPKVTAAEKAMIEAGKKADDANGQYQSRLSLYGRYLQESQALGTDRASIGTADGVKAGTVEARTKANKLATENASAEAKWVAMRRGYIRGEIGGYETGFDVGMASSSDASQGDADGKIAGMKRAKDHANLVMKPEFYLEELNRRLVEDEVTKKAMAFLTDDVSTVVSAKMVMKRSDVPELTQEEIDASQRILSSLDALIEQAQISSEQVVSVRPRLADPRAVYTTPAPGENAATANCSGVYKNVKEFIEACKTSYGSTYPGLYAAAHQNAFTQEYGKAFSDQIIKTFEAELARLYPGYLKEATAIGKDVGVSEGKKEVYRQSFTRSELASYSATIPSEEARVEGEAVAQVEEHLKGNAALTLKGEPKLKATSTYGIAPGTEADLKMMIKNIGNKASLGNSLVKIKEVSRSLLLASKDAALASVAPKSLTELSVMKVKVDDAAMPGERVVLAGEIVHPGNDYRASRVEAFRLETVLGVNPSIDGKFNFDGTPKISNLFGTKKHGIDFAFVAKYSGTEQGYEVVIEEQGTSFASFTASKLTTERLARNVTKTLSFEYKLSKAAKAKTINFKVSIKYGSEVVSTSVITIKPE